MPKSSTIDQKGDFMNLKFRSRMRTSPSLHSPCANEDNSVQRLKSKSLSRMPAPRIFGHGMMTKEEKIASCYADCGNVPKDFWGQCDPATDPALNGNSVASLLNAPTATGSMPLVMGLNFQPPLPSISKDSMP
ncbi:hypothetical protein TGAM01_v208188 [Trichoderma gamsii]|uniref:Uncharacterized protein n=1 Tax=Trichoderma gamsii TaxID=398673 RepID=A0A2P4ZF81_9HYPO|nr:hypothetical protein TGAM01_v208188 [Trichoderma gamsii]PON22933.1 hypothetical protein TGAM01_v208188 [Trichoderma gamsii]